jgi:hypothetical protein
MFRLPKAEDSIVNKNNDYQRFFPDDESNNQPIVVEVPAEPRFHSQEKLPSPYDPMGEIHFRGMAFRNLAGGGISWWVLIAGWALYGGLAVLMLVLAASSGGLAALPVLAFSLIYLVILWRGTVAKLSSQPRRRNNRRR